MSELTPPPIVGVFDRAADIYDSLGIEFFSVFGRWLVDAASLAPGERVLDVGSGRGAATFPAAEAVGPRGRVVACDLAPRMVELLRRDVSARGLGNVEVRLDDAQAPRCDAESFDCVLASMVVFMLPDPGAALANWRRLLRPGGRIALSTFGADDPRWGWLPRMVDAVPEELRPRQPDLTGRWKDGAHVRASLESAGFTDVESREREWSLHFRDPQQWIEWSHSQGHRRIWELIPLERRDEVIRRATANLLAIRDADGTIPMRSIVRITTARRPA